MYKLLIVDDESKIRNGLRNMINWEDYGISIVGEASNGKEAYHDIRRLEPDMVITDMKMPVMSGIDLIKKTHEKQLRIGYIIISAYNEFNYVKEALKYNVENYLLKPIDKTELQMTMEELIHKLEEQKRSDRHHRDGFESMRSNILNRIIKKNIGVLEFREKANMIGLDIASNSLQVAVIDVYKTKDYLCMSAKEMLIVRDEVCKICHQMLRQEEDIVFLDLEGRTVIIHKNHEKHNLEKVTKRVLEHVEGVMATVSIGDRVNSWTTLSLSYNQAVEAQDYRFVKQPLDTIMYNDIMERRNLIKGIHVDYDLIEEYIQCNREEELMVLIDTIFEQSIELNATYMGLIYNIAIEIVVIIMRIMRVKKGELSEIIQEDRIVGSILEKKTVDELHYWLTNLCKKTLSYLRDQCNSPHHQYSKIVQDIIAYLHVHYTEEISLKVLSQIMFFNPVYMGTVFRNETGEIFTNYMNKIRIGKAKDLLTKTNYKARDIASMVGFKNPNYFYTVFKKYTELTPKEYRRKN